MIIISNSFCPILRRLFNARPNTRLSSSLCIDRTFSIPVGNNGNVTLSVTQPKDNTSQTQRPNVILYLPPGPLFSQYPSLAYTQNLTPQHGLASTTLSTVVTVNYRLGSVGKEEKPEEHQEEAIQHETPSVEYFKYPTPIHDTLAGFDWILQTLQPAHLSVLGTHTGGSLALMLALTEAQTVRAVAALEPICDWTGLDEYCTISADGSQSSSPSNGSATTKKKAKRVQPSVRPDLVPLLEARERYFHTAERYFDAFASPLLFLRSAGKDVPKAFPRYLTGPEYPVPVLRSRSMDDIGGMDIHISDDEPEDGSISTSASDPETDPVENSKGTVVRRRKALSRWPPYGLDYGLSGANSPYRAIGRLEMTLPWVRLFVRDETPESSQHNHSNGAGNRKPGNQTVLARQAEEMVNVMRRACFWGREKGYGERKVTLARDSAGGKDAAMWLRDVVETD